MSRDAGLRPGEIEAERLARIEERLETLEAGFAKAEDLYLKFMGGAGRKLLRMLGAELPKEPG
jgi:hypothetical protein